MNGARLHSLRVVDFRSISGSWEIPLDADVVLLHGLNGAGKTSVLSALELAAIGRIAHLERAGDSSYAEHLHHSGTNEGRAVLSVRTPQGELRESAVSVGPTGIDGAPLLTGARADFFVERCFLPQTTLARLLEIYAPDVKQGGDSALIRFVKELLGLDELDSLVDGLYASGHVARSRALSTAWQVALRRMDDHDRRAAVAESNLRAVRRRLDEAISAIRAELARRGIEDATDTDLIPVSERLIASGDAASAERQRLNENLLRLDGGANALSSTPGRDTIESWQAARDGLAQVEAAHSKWWAWQGQVLLTRLDEANADHEPTPSAPDNASRLLGEAIARSQAELEATQAHLQDLRAASARVASLQAELAQFASGLEASERRRAALRVSGTAGDLSRILADVLEHIDSRKCPVCDQDFDGGQNNLRAHIVEKIERLTGDAANLMAIDREMAQLRSRTEDTTRALGAARRDLSAFGEEPAISQAAARGTRVLGELRELVPFAEAADALAERVRRSRDAAASLTRTTALLGKIQEDLAAMFVEYALTPEKGGLHQQIAQLRAHIEGQSARQTRLQESDDRLRAALREWAASNSKVVEVSVEVSAARVAATALRAQIEEATRRKEVASALRKEAQEVRSAVVNRVFDEQLNESWRRVFRNLVPSEPYVPQFRRQVGSSRVTSVELETVDSRGRPAASPAAMLSYGNVNTAALSLFLALHFAVPVELPWLIFDDPVQSMDDLHVANFAAMVKQLTRRNGRQVVIAVHQRELFDYLALELTPASERESVRLVTLERNYGRTSIVSELRGFVADSALARGRVA